MNKKIRNFFTSVIMIVFIITGTIVPSVSVAASMVKASNNEEFVGSVSNGEISIPVNKVNGNRDADTVVIYTTDYGTTTKTGKYGVEIIVDKVDNEYQVVGVLNGLVAPNTNDATIPINGFVISTIDTSGSTLLRNKLLDTFKVGTKILLEDIDLNPIKDVIYNIDTINPSVIEKDGELVGENNGFPGGRGSDQLVIYTSDYGHSRTGTNQFGTEVKIVDGIVEDITGFNTEIPSNGFVVSGHGKAKDFITSNLTIGSKVEIDEINMKIHVKRDAEVYINLAEKEMYNSELSLKEAKKNNIDAPLDKAEERINISKDKIEKAKNLANSNPTESIVLAKEAKEIALLAYYNTTPSKKEEMRGVWHRPTEKTREQVIATLDKFADANFNTVFLETFYHGYTIYPSEVADIRPEFEDIGFDLLQVYIEEGAKRGIDIHCWVEDFYVGNKMFQNDINGDGVIDVGAGESTGSPIIDKHPEWAAKMKNGEYYLTTESGYIFMNVALPDVQDYLEELYSELLNKYDIKGLQLDYIRYPVNHDENDSIGFDDYSRAQVKEIYKFDLMDITKEGNREEWAKFSEWKQNNVTNFVERISRRMKEVNSNVQISTSVFGNPTEAIDLKNQNWPEWIEKGYLDFISPMAYLDFPDAVKDEVENMVDNYGQVNNYAGISPMYHKLPPVESVKQVMAVREAGARGVVFFDSKDLSSDQIVALKEGPFRDKASLPRTKPEIIAKDITILEREKVDLLNGVTAVDRDGKDITSLIKIKENTVDENNAGTYKVVYIVTDEGGAISDKEIKVTVKENNIEEGNSDGNTEDEDSDKDENVPGNGNEDIPRTGDKNGNIMIYMILCLVASGYIYSRKKVVK